MQTPFQRLDEAYWTGLFPLMYTYLVVGWVGARPLWNVVICAHPAVNERTKFPFQAQLGEVAMLCKCIKEK